MLTNVFNEFKLLIFGKSDIIVKNVRGISPNEF